jgi:hypothetical protein
VLSVCRKNAGACSRGPCARSDRGSWKWEPAITGASNTVTVDNPASTPGGYGLWLGHRSAVQSEAVYLMKKSPAFFRRGAGWEEAGRRMCF